MRMFAATLFALVCVAAPAAAQESWRIGPFEAGMSPHEIDQLAPGAVRFQSVQNPDGTVGRGTVRAFDADFQVIVVSYWNTGARLLGLTHYSEEDSETCAAIRDAALSDLVREFGATPTMRRESEVWVSYWNRDTHPEWRVRWMARWGPYPASRCAIDIHVSSDPPQRPDPLLVEFALDEPIAGSPVWAAQPTLEQVQALHPERAAEREVGGQASLGCRVIDASGALHCLVRREDPSGWGFGAAALQVARFYRIAPETGGLPTVGRKLELTVDFTNVPERRPAYSH